MNNEMRERLHVLTGFKGLLRFFLYFLFVFPGFFWCVCCGEVGAGWGEGVKKVCSPRRGTKTTSMKLQSRTTKFKKLYDAVQ